MFTITEDGVWQSSVLRVVGGIASRYSRQKTIGHMIPMIMCNEIQIF